MPDSPRASIPLLKAFAVLGLILTVCLPTVASAAKKRGPTGPTGATGPSGPRGSTGPAGPTGVTGPTGPSGPSGSSGPSGPSGSTGPSGPSGPSGTPGTAGAGVTEIPFGSGVDLCSSTTMSALDSDEIDFMGPGRILEDDCNALEPDFKPRAADVQMPLTTTGHIHNLNVSVVCQDSTDLGSGEWIFTVDNAPSGSSIPSQTAVTCPVKSLVGTAAPFIGTCQDTTHSAAFNPGDQLSIEITPSPMGGPNDDSCVVNGAVVEFGR